jgi:hypothetical protein
MTMGLIELGTNPVGIGADPGLIGERKAFIKDMRATYEVLAKLGLGKMLSSRDGRVAIRKLSLALMVIVQNIGYPAFLTALTLMSDLARRHKKYMAMAENNPGEFKLLQNDVKMAFADVEMRHQHAQRLGVKNIPRSARKSRLAVMHASRSTSMGGVGILLGLAAAGAGIFLATKAFSSSDSAATGTSPSALLDFFIRLDAGTASSAEYDQSARLAKSVGLPLTAQAIRAHAKLQGLPQNEMWPGTKTPVFTYVNSYVGRFKALAEISPAKGATDNAKAQILSYMIKYARAKFNMPPGSEAPGYFDKAAVGAAAILLKLPLTAKALLSDSGLPSSEMWPGSASTVDLYVKTYLTRMGLVAGPQLPYDINPQMLHTVSNLIRNPAAATMFKAGAGTTKTQGEDMHKEIGRTIEDMEGLDLGGEHEDMTGVYSTGLSELVGETHSKQRARQGRMMVRRAPTGKMTIVRRTGAGVSPMNQPVRGVTVRRPGIARINVDRPLIVSSSRLAPGMQMTIDPATAQLLRMIKDGNKYLRNDGISLVRTRAGWPGSRGGRAY